MAQPRTLTIDNVLQMLRQYHLIDDEQVKHVLVKAPAQMARLRVAQQTDLSRRFQS